MRFASTAQVLAQCKLKYYRISECIWLYAGAPPPLAEAPLTCQGSYARTAWQSRIRTSRLRQQYGHSPLLPSSHSDTCSVLSQSPSLNSRQSSKDKRPARLQPAAQSAHTKPPPGLPNSAVMSPGSDPRAQLSGAGRSEARSIAGQADADMDCHGMRDMVHGHVPAQQRPMRSLGSVASYSSVAVFPPGSQAALSTSQRPKVRLGASLQPSRRNPSWITLGYL